MGSRWRWIAIRPTLALAKAHAALDATRPTAVNLRWALDRVRNKVAALAPADRADAAWLEADAIATEDVAINHAIGEHGLAMLRSIATRRSGPVSVMTHCNAGALATCGWGTATSPLFLAHAEGLALHVWVSETRPRLQGASLTTWELAQRGIPHTLFADSASGILMQRGEVDVVIVGADRVAANGDVCNKVGTYDKALAARDNNVPFYVALPSPTIDWAMRDRRVDPHRDARHRRGPHHDRPRRIRPGDPRGAGPAWHQGRQLRIRRDTRPARDGPRDGARHHPRVAKVAGGDVPQQRDLTLPLLALRVVAMDLRDLRSDAAMRDLALIGVQRSPERWTLTS